MDCSTPGLSVLQHCPELAQTHVHWVDDAIKQSHRPSPSSPPAFNLSHHQGLFQWVESLHHMVRHWSFSFSIGPSNEYSGLISFKIDWFDVLAVQGIFKSLQHHSSKAWLLRCSAFFLVQVSYLCVTTGKTIALTIWTFVGKIMSLLFNMLSTFVKVFLPHKSNRTNDYSLSKMKQTLSVYNKAK